MPTKQKPENRDHNGGGEQNRRKPQGGNPEQVEKNPPRDADGKTAQDTRQREKSARIA
jgi:hypothetical protein